MKSDLRRTFAVTTLLLTILFIFSGCGQTVSSYEDAYTMVSEPTSLLKTTPDPDGDVLITMSGDLNQTNIGNELHLDLGMLESIGVIEYSLDDPFEERMVTYRGVLMRDMLAAAGVDENATKLKITALNDYAIEMPISEFEQYPIMLALQADGEYMQPDYRGPGMLVYPLHAYDTFDMNLVQDNWIWQIKSIEVL